MFRDSRLALRIGGVLVFAVFLSGAAAEAQEAQEVAGPAVAECVATIQPERLSIQPNPVNLSAVYSESIGKVISALIDESSGIEIMEVVEPNRPADDPNAQAVNVKLDLSEAVAGEWTLSFEGESGKCTAKVTVQAADTPTF